MANFNAILCKYIDTCMSIHGIQCCGFAQAEKTELPVLLCRTLYAFLQ